jgi:hypothetical protein
MSKIKGRIATTQEIADYCRYLPQDIDLLAEMLPDERAEFIGRNLEEASKAPLPIGVVQSTWQGMSDVEKAAFLICKERTKDYIGVLLGDGK